MTKGWHVWFEFNASKEIAMKTRLSKISFAGSWFQLVWRPQRILWFCCAWQLICAWGLCSEALRRALRALALDTSFHCSLAMVFYSSPHISTEGCCLFKSCWLLQQVSTRLWSKLPAQVRELWRSGLRFSTIFSPISSGFQMLCSLCGSFSFFAGWMY